MAQLAFHKIAKYVTVIVRTIDMVAKNRGPIVKIIDEFFFLEKTNTTVY